MTPVDEQEHLIRQARFGEELTNLDNVLKQKELQLKKMKSGEEEMDNIRHKYEESVNTLEKEVCKLTKEKKELMKSVKVSEERRKKVWCSLEVVVVVVVVVVLSYCCPCKILYAASFPFTRWRFFVCLVG